MRVPVIAVGRLGDPAIATAAVASGKADFIALGRTLVADPQWVEKLRRGEPIRRCLACNTCINEMRGGARIGCVVNGAAGRETVFAQPKPPHGERIAVIGAGPAGLTYASLVAEGNTVTVFEKEHRSRRRLSAMPARRRCSRKSRRASGASSATSPTGRPPALARASSSASRPTSPHSRSCWRRSTAS